MFSTTIGWAFVSFIYFNITFGWVLKQAGISVFLALNLALAVGVTIAAADDVYRHRLFRYNQLPGILAVGYSTLARVTAIPFLVAVVACSLAARLIVYVSSVASQDGGTDIAQRGDGAGAFAAIFVIVAVPTTIHWLMSLHQAHNSANGESVDL